MYTQSCKTLKSPHHAVIKAIRDDDEVLMSILMDASSLGSQLPDKYDRPQYYHNDSSIYTVKNQTAEAFYGIRCCQKVHFHGKQCFRY